MLDKQKLYTHRNVRQTKKLDKVLQPISYLFILSPTSNANYAHNYARLNINLKPVPPWVHIIPGILMRLPVPQHPAELAQVVRPGNGQDPGASSRHLHESWTTTYWQDNYQQVEGKVARRTGHGG